MIHRLVYSLLLISSACVEIFVMKGNTNYCLILLLLFISFNASGISLLILWPVIFLKLSAHSQIWKTCKYNFCYKKNKLIVLVMFPLKAVLTCMEYCLVGICRITSLLELLMFLQIFPLIICELYIYTFQYLLLHMLVGMNCAVTCTFTSRNVENNHFTGWIPPQLTSINSLQWVFQTARI